MQQLVRQRGPTRVRLRDDCERAALLDFFGNVHKGRERQQIIGQEQVWGFLVWRCSQSCAVILADRRCPFR